MFKDNFDSLQAIHDPIHDRGAVPHCGAGQPAEMLTCLSTCCFHLLAARPCLPAAQLIGQLVVKRHPGSENL